MYVHQNVLSADYTFDHLSAKFVSSVKCSKWPNDRIMLYLYIYIYKRTDLVQLRFIYLHIYVYMILYLIITTFHMTHMGAITVCLFVCLFTGCNYLLSMSAVCHDLIADISCHRSLWRHIRWSWWLAWWCVDEPSWQRCTSAGWCRCIRSSSLRCPVNRRSIRYRHSTLRRIF